MRQIKKGNIEDYIKYLNENSGLDRSILALNLKTIFNMGKREAAQIVTEWFLNNRV